MKVKKILKVVLLNEHIEVFYVKSRFKQAHKQVFCDTANKLRDPHILNCRIMAVYPESGKLMIRLDAKDWKQIKKKKAGR